MLFEIDEIPDTGLEFAVSEKKDRFDIDQPDCSLAEDVRVEGCLTKLDHEVSLKGRVRSVLSVLCTRCLESFRFQVDGKLTAQFLPETMKSSGSADRELHSGDIDTEFYQDNQIDITQVVRDQILLALPQICICRKDCCGLCPDCGINLNRETCSCGGKKAVDPRFDVLKTLKEKLK